ncbi:hypothetical protein AB6A40_000877 [Gnathostoma spinigerum]|uniref:ANK_REP_REGION domain-containing protein n=1 Tax=Gnathostoma spinigerum TaxID=75299 RepID=A0ABD6E2Y3_9BILA
MDIEGGGSSSSPCRRHPEMECERWLRARLEDLRSTRTLDQKPDFNNSNLPQKLDREYNSFNPFETNIRGETLIMSVVRYEPDQDKQIRFINLLVRSGCDPSAPDVRQLRTPLMLALLMKNEAIAQCLIRLNVNLKAADKMGNTTLMYAVMYSNAAVLSTLLERLSQEWCIDVLRQRNQMGYTAENIARRNGRYLFSMLLRKERAKIVKKLQQHVKQSPDVDILRWTWFTTLYKVKRKFLSLRRDTTDDITV